MNDTAKKIVSDLLIQNIAGQSADEAHAETVRIITRHLAALIDELAVGLVEDENFEDVLLGDIQTSAASNFTSREGAIKALTATMRTKAGIEVEK